MKRLPDWQLRLEAFARERRTMPFAWGTNDCATFAAAGIEALTGEVVLPEIRGYTEREALRLIEEHGGLRRIVGLALGNENPAIFAAVGDVVMVESGKREALAICNGATAIGAGPDGVVAVSMATAKAAWRVG